MLQIKIKEKIKENLNTPLIVLAAFGVILSACGGAAGAKKGSSLQSTLANSLSAPPALSVTSILPGDGAVASIPSQVSINFSGANLDTSLLASPTSYTINCGGNPIAAASVNYIPGVANVTVSLAAMSVANGTVCTFSVSNNIKDSNGNFVTGVHSVNYTINSNTTVGGSGGGWAPASSATLLSSVGNPSGTYFSGVGGYEMALQGLLLNGSNYVDGIVGVWAYRFYATSLAYGQPHGASAGGYTQLSCPSQYRVVGIYGTSSGAIDSLGIVCMNETQTASYRSSKLGSSGGTAFEQICPAGQFVTDLNGRAGTYLNQLALGCK